MLTHDKALRLDVVRTLITGEANGPKESAGLRGKAPKQHGDKKQILLFPKVRISNQTGQKIRSGS